MTHGSTRKLVALLGGGVILVISGWLDTEVIVAVGRSANQTFDPSGIAWAVSFGYLIVAGAVLAIALLARWAQSILVGLIYAAVGAFLAFLSPLNWVLAAGLNGAPPFLPGPIASLVNNAYFNTEQGPLNAVAIIGAGMLVVGLASIGSALRTPSAAAAADPATGPLRVETDPDGATVR